MAVRFILRAELEESEVLQRKAYLTISRGWFRRRVYSGTGCCAVRAAVKSVNQLTAVCVGL